MPEGDYKIEDTIAILTDEEGNDIPVTMIPVSYTHLIMIPQVVASERGLAQTNVVTAILGL